MLRGALAQLAQVTTHRVVRARVTVVVHKLLPDPTGRAIRRLLQEVCDHLDQTFQLHTAGDGKPWISQNFGGH